jgi:3-deoxy-D-manno-octulosonic-acid transferase
VRRSGAGSAGHERGTGPGVQGAAPPRRFLLDTIGELRKAYSLADVVVVGRSFGDQYGSDPIEPIALGKAAVIGPAVSDFAQIVASGPALGHCMPLSCQPLLSACSERITAWR